MDEDEVAHRLRSRTDPASEAAVACLDAGARWWSSVETVSVASERRDWSRPEDDRFNPGLKIVGRDELLVDLAATRHSTLHMATLDSTRGALPPDRFSVYLAPGTNEVVACVGVLTVPNPPVPVYKRDEVPDTIDGAAKAFLSFQHSTGEAAPFEVTVRRELDSPEAEQLYSAWPHRTRGWYKSARTITVLGAAEVSCAFIQGRLYAPTRERFEGYLLIIDIAPDPEVKRHKHGRVDALLLTRNSRGGIGLRVVMPFQYQAEDRAGP